MFARLKELAKSSGPQIYEVDDDGERKISVDAGRPAKKRKAEEAVDEQEELIKAQRVMDMVSAGLENKAELEFDVLKNPLQMYAVAEREWKANNDKYINCPNHICEPDICVMDRIDVIVYSKKNTQIHTAFDNHVELPSKQGGMGACRPQMFHVCIPQVCVHLKKGHDCPKPRDCRERRCEHIPRFCSQRGGGGGERASGGGAVMISHIRTPECSVNRCQHFVPFQVCMQSAACPHNCHYTTDEVRELKDMWICRRTGVAHICGEACMQRRIYAEREKHHICALTKTILQISLEHPEAWRYGNNAGKVGGKLDHFSRRHGNLLMDGNNNNNNNGNTNGGQMILGGGGGSGSRHLTEDGAVALLLEDPASYAARRHGESKHSNHSTSTGGKSRTSSKSRAAAIPIWERNDDIVMNIALTKLIFIELMFSEKRQLMEIDAVLVNRRQMYREMHKTLRHKKIIDEVTPEVQQMYTLIAAQESETTLYRFSAPTRVPLASAMFSKLAKRSLYFTHVPIMSKLIRYVKIGFEDIRCRYALTKVDAELQANAPLKTQKQREVERIKNRCDALLENVLEACSEEEEEEQEPDPPEILAGWETAEWKARAEALTDLVARTVVRVWINLCKHCVDWEGKKADVNFRRIVLPLIYMLQSNFTLKAQDTAGIDRSDRTPQIIVIPQVDFTKLLPTESTIADFNIHAYCAPSSKTITPIQTMIQQLLWAAAQKGKAHLLKLRLVDIAAENRGVF